MQRSADCVSLSLARSYLGRHVTVDVDRPMGSRHPSHEFVYLVNYGYLPDVVAPDGDNLDAYILGVDVPVRTFYGLCIAVIDRWDDDDAKLVVVPGGMVFSDGEIRAQVHFVEQFFDSHIVRT